MAADDGRQAAIGETGAARDEEIARAKVNLFLHVRGRVAGGYHALDSLAVFPAFGDRLEASPAASLDLTVDGPFAGALGTGDNLVLAAARALSGHLPGRPGAAIRLDKRLPVAAGVGGGSADAGAALRLLARLWRGSDGVAGEDLEEIARGLGADAPVCLHARPAMMAGVGEKLTPAPAFPGFWMALVNPGQPLSTAEVFGALDRRDGPAGPPPPQAFRDLGHLVAWLTRQRNDLERPARRLRPAIGRVLSALAWDKDCRIARMSGSGATCFGLYEGEAAARAAVDRLRAEAPDWWAAAAEVEPWDGTAGGAE